MQTMAPSREPVAKAFPPLLSASSDATQRLVSLEANAKPTRSGQRIHQDRSPIPAFPQLT